MTIACLGAFGVSAQEAEPPSRPLFLQAMGLLEAQAIDINRDGTPFVSLTLFQGDGVRPVARDTSAAGGDIVASWDFVTEDGRFVESLTLTTASVDIAPSETRRFALANMLVLRSFPQIARQFSEARLLAFGPMENDNGLDVVQMVGSFSPSDSDRDILFRHVGTMHPERAEIVVAIINVDTDVLPVRSDTDVVDTFAGQSFRTLTFDASE